jgi:hypothetical protein
MARYCPGVPRVRDIPTLERTRWVEVASALALILGVIGVIALVSWMVAGPDVGGVWFVVAVVGVWCCFAVAVLAFRAARAGSADETSALTHRDERRQELGLDDGLPWGAFRVGDRIGLEPMAPFLAFAAVVWFGLVAALAAFAVTALGWWSLLVLAVFGGLPAALLFRVGSQTRVWLTPEGIERDHWPRRFMRWEDVATIVPLSHNTPVKVGYADMFSLRTSDYVGGMRPWEGHQFLVRNEVLQINPFDLYQLLLQHAPTAAQDPDVGVPK